MPTQPLETSIIQCGTGDTAVKFTYDPSVTYTYGPPYVSVYNAPKSAADYPDAKALIAEYEIMFPEVITESSKRLYHWTKLVFNKADGTTANHFETLDFSTGVISESDPSTKFSIRYGSKYKNIEAEKYYKITQVLDFDEKLISYYIDGEHFADSNVNMYDSLKWMDYIRFVGTNVAPKGFVIDNYHYYYATDVAPIVEEEASIYQRARIYADVIDFEPVEGKPYTIGGGAVKKPNGSNLVNVQNSSFGVSAEVKTYLSDKTTLSGSVRTTTIATIPSGYANGEGKGTTALKVTGDGYATYGGISQFNINLSNGGNRYPGSSTASTIAQEGDIYVSQFDFAFDALPSDQIIIAEHRNDASWGRYSTLYMLATGQLKFHGTTTKKYLSPKTWYNIKFVGYSATGVLELYVDNELVTTLTSTSANKLGYWDSLRIYGGQGNKATREEVYYDNMNFFIGTDIPGTFTVEGYEAGVTEEGADITLTATTNEIGETATIQRSDDGANWTDVGTNTVSVKTTEDSVYYRAIYGVNYSEPIVVYGVAEAKVELIKRANIFDIDFESEDDKSYELKSGTLYYNNAVVKNPDGGQFSAANKETVKKGEDGTTYELTGSTRMSELVDAPSYANNTGIGSKVLRLTGDGYEMKSTTSMSPGGASQVLIRLGENADGNYPGPTTGSNVDQAGDVYVTEFDFAYDEKQSNRMHICEFRNNGGGISRYFVVWLAANGAVQVHGHSASSTILEPKTWYKIKIVANSSNGVIETYVNDTLIDTYASTTATLGYWDSFRVWGSQKNSVLNDVVYYDNFNFYIAQPKPTPDRPELKLAEIVYKDNEGEVVSMQVEHTGLNATATVKNNGIAGQAVVIFARYTNNGKKLAAISIKPITMAAGQTSIQVKGDLGDSYAKDKVKVFIWDGLGTLVPGATTANNAEL